MVKNLSCVSVGSMKRFPHTFTKVTYSTTHQRLVEVQFGRYQKNILQE